MKYLLMICFFMAPMTFAEDLQVHERKLTTEIERDIVTGAVSARTDRVEICVFRNVGDSNEACNNRLSTFSIMSNDRVQITGKCTGSPDSLYCSILSGRVTILD